MKKILSLAILLMCCQEIMAKHALDVHELLRLAEKNSHSIKEAQFNVLVAQKEIELAKAAYFPVVRAEAIDSTGFPGSSSWLGVEGLMGSPYRSGLSGGLVAKQMVVDFGRTVAAVKSASSHRDVLNQTRNVTAYEVKVLALQVYFNCARFKSQSTIWSQLAKESEIITKEAKRFVSTGQRSIVDKYLADSQTAEAHTAQAFFSARARGSVNELSVITGLAPNQFDCPLLSSRLVDSLNPKSQVAASPYVRRAEAQVKVAQDVLSLEKADMLPKIMAIGSAGGLEQARLVSLQNYAVGVGIVMPVFDQTIRSKIHRARAEVLAKQQNVQAQKQIIEEMNAQLEQVIQASAIKLRHLNNELSIAREGYDVAKRRYFKFEGALIDLREAWRNLARAEIAIEETRGDLMQAKGAKALLNGRA